MKLKNIIPLVAIVAIMGFATRLAIGLTVNERYEDAVETLKESGVFCLNENGSVTFTTTWEVERSTISALNEISKHHELIIYTR